MIRLEHINLVVKTLSSSLAFYQAAFPHWQVRQEGKSDWHGVARNWLHFGDEYNYVTLNESGDGQNRDLTSNQIGLAHFAFEVTHLKGLIERLALAGFEPHHMGAKNTYRENVYFIDPSGFEVEFVQYFSDVPAARNNSNDD